MEYLNHALTHLVSAGWVVVLLSLITIFVIVVLYAFAALAFDTIENYRIFRCLENRNYEESPHNAHSEPGAEAWKRVLPGDIPNVIYRSTAELQINGKFVETSGPILLADDKISLRPEGFIHRILFSKLYQKHLEEMRAEYQIHEL